MSSTNRGAERNPSDFYPTPLWATQALLTAIPDLADGVWCEPAVGDGAIVRAVEASRPGRQRWIVGDLRPQAVDEVTALASVIDAVALGDFAAGSVVSLLSGADVYITNPPFSLAESFARSLIDRAASKGATVAMLLRLAFLESAARIPFHAAHPADIYPFATRPSFSPDGKTDSAAYAWFVWGPGRGRRWFAPLPKPARTRR